MNLTVTYKRTMQIVQYEPSTIEATLSDIPVTSGDDVQAIVYHHTRKLEAVVEKTLLEIANGIEAEPI